MKFELPRLKLVCFFTEAGVFQTEMEGEDGKMGTIIGRTELLSNSLWGLNNGAARSPITNTLLATSN